MKVPVIFLISIFLLGGSATDFDAQVITDKTYIEIPIEGKWVRIGQRGLISLIFLKGGVVEVDFGNDQSIDVRSRYAISQDIIRFQDMDGKTCPFPGIYRLHKSDHHIALDILNDQCTGRIHITTGFWIRPEIQHTLNTLQQKIADTNDPKLHLERGRVFLAMGESDKAQADFNIYMRDDSTNARAYMNRAATFFPHDLEGVVRDCDRALSLDSGLKNAYFMRGLAAYELGYKESACEDFHKAIELGFSVLKEAEKSKCMEYWDNR